MTLRRRMNRRYEEGRVDALLDLPPNPMDRGDYEGMAYIAGYQIGKALRAIPTPTYPDPGITEKRPKR